MLDSVLTTSSLANLIEPGRIHRRVYTDPAIFDLEMERLFGRAWLFVGHESQIRHPGDFITTDLGKYPVIMTHHADGSVQVWRVKKGTYSSLDDFGSEKKAPAKPATKSAKPGKKKGGKRK